MISVLIPALNEEKFIETTINTLLNQVDVPEDYEIIVLDGGSSDATVSRATGALGVHGIVVDNPGKTVPEAIRIGLHHARGQKIVVAGAHAEYPARFLQILAGNLVETDVGAAGGILVAKPADSERTVSVAIADVLASRFGVGFSHRTAERNGITDILRVKTVAFPMYRREVFERIGSYDSRFVRAHDLEFHMRMVSEGWTILQIPSVKVGYFARPDVLSAAQMAFDYGHWKPLVNRCHTRLSSIRQLFPVVVVFVLLLAILGVTNVGLPRWTMLGGLGYAVSVVIASTWLGLRNRRWHLMPLYALIFTILHIGYGTGYIAGLLRSLWAPIRPQTKTLA